MPWSLLLFPLVGAAIGWFTNYLAVKMLFRPRQPFRLGGLTIQGLIPRRREELAQSIAAAVEQELLDADDIVQALESEAFRDRLTAVLDERLATLLREKLASRPLAGQFLTEDVLAPIRRAIIGELLKAFPSAAGVFRDALSQHLDVRALVLEKVQRLDVEALEALVFRVARREFRYIEVVGGVIGFLVGLAQLLLATMVG